MFQTPTVHRKKEWWTTAAFYVFSGILTASWASRIPDVQGQLGMNNAAWGTILLSVYAGLFTGLFFSSWLIAKYGTKRMMVFSCVSTAVMLCGAGFAPNRVGLMVALFAFGSLRTIMNIAANTQAVQVQKLFEKPIVSTFHGLWSGASFVAAGIGTLMIIGGFSPAVHFLIIGGLMVAGALFFWPPPLASAPVVPEKRPFFIMPDRYLFLLGLIAFCGMLCEGAMFDWSVNYFEKAVGADKEWVTTGYTAFIITMALGRFTGDRATAAFGPYTLLMYSGLLMAAGFLTAVFFPVLLPAAFGFLLIGLGDSIVVPMVYSLAARSTKMPPGYAIASVTMIGYGGFMLGPLLIGHTSEALNMQWAFGIVAIFSLCITALAARVKKEKKEPRISQGEAGK